MKYPIPALGAAAILLVLCTGAGAFDGISGQDSAPTAPVITQVVDPLVRMPAAPTIAMPDHLKKAARTLTQRIDTDLVKADEHDLGRLYAIPDDPVSHVLAAMALERLHLNLDKSSQDAAACEKVLHMTKPDIAAYCALFAVGDTRLAGHSQQADQMLLDITQRYATAISATELARLKEVTQDNAGRPDMLVRRPDHTVTIPLGKPFFADNDERYVEVSANGKVRHLVLDSGADSLLVNESTARAWGAHIVAGDTRQIQGYFSQDIAARHGWIDRLDLGGIVIENAPVTIITDGPELIGIDVLRRLGAIRIKKSALVVYGGSDARPSCSAPMLVASSRDGNGFWLQHYITIDGSVHTIMIDTGSANYLSGNAAVRDQYDDSPATHGWATDAGSQKVKIGMRVANRNVVIAGQPIKMLFVVFTNDHQPWGYILGNLALQDMDFYFDFDNRHTCLFLHDKLY
jgi:hypothetical protein